MPFDETRVLLLSNNALSTTGSNGRTLLGLLAGIQRQNLAQIYVSGSVPDVEAASSYFRITDQQAVAFALGGQQPGSTITPIPPESPGSAPARLPPRRPRRTPLTMVAREMAWFLAEQRGPRQMFQFVSEFNPNVVVLQAGDSAFMFRLATRIARQRKIPLVIYNSEDYYFKTNNYLAGTAAQRPLYTAWHAYFRRSVRRAFGVATHVIYSCEPLREAFDLALKTNSSTVLTSSSVEPRSLDHPEVPSRLVYAGNLGLGRFESLVDLAGHLDSLAPECTLTVYGPRLESAELQRAAAIPNLEYRGFLPYAEIVRELREADVTVHVESFDPEITRNIRYAFSTKIADCLTSGTPLLLYAPAEIASTRYVLGHRAGIVATTRAGLPAAIKSMLSQRERLMASDRAIAVARRNHDPVANATEVVRILQSARLAGGGGGT